MTKYILLAPQPNSSSILHVERVVSKLKGSQFLRRVTVVHALPPHMKSISNVLNLALFEYLGKFPGFFHHGSSKCDEFFSIRNRQLQMQGRRCLNKE